MDFPDPAFHQSSLAGFFRRHDIATPSGDGLSRFQRMGLALKLATCLRAADFRTTASLAHRPGLTINGHLFSHEDWTAGMDIAIRLAGTFEAIEQEQAPAHNGAPVDRMALLFLKAEEAGLPADADMLAREGLAPAIITEFALEAAQLAEAIKCAVRAYNTAAAARESQSLPEAA
ncbi:hypothetical protein AncyloWKF20_05275 [Ancylobacter sp. WKF20]|uniref:hypothetical protein n=1 Tax=Ancylobacter sp. WKF20 TaxID=3039801 RepID=UPI00243446E7|nr:hypothetical protein [Ancylobacter sp. WKF20]WGD31236.1 hypothetical protein AncyloWKF20_05275 [Ancylobacter sp. WKF20]